MGERISTPNPIPPLDIPCRKCHFRYPLGYDCPRCTDREAAERGLVSALLRWLRAVDDVHKDDDEF
jgi:hypothetical protein